MGEGVPAVVNMIRCLMEIEAPLKQNKAKNIWVWTPPVTGSIRLTWMTRFVASVVRKALGGVMWLRWGYSSPIQKASEGGFGGTCGIFGFFGRVCWWLQYLGERIRMFFYSSRDFQIGDSWCTNLGATPWRFQNTLRECCNIFGSKIKWLFWYISEEWVTKWQTFWLK